MEELRRRWARNLIDSRTQCFYTQSELAKKSHISQSAISLIERGISHPTDPVKIKLARALNMKVGKLFPLPRTYREKPKQ